MFFLVYRKHPRNLASEASPRDEGEEAQTLSAETTSEDQASSGEEQGWTEEEAAQGDDGVSYAFIMMFGKHPLINTNTVDSIASSH